MRRRLTIRTLMIAVAVLAMVFAMIWNWDSPATMLAMYALACVGPVVLPYWYLVARPPPD